MCTPALLQQGVGGEGKLNMGRSLETGSSEHRTELLISIRKALGSHQRRWSRQSSKVDHRRAMEEDSGRMRKNWRQETWEESKLGTDPHPARVKITEFYTQPALS